MALITNAEYRQAIKSRMRVLAKRLHAKTEVDGFVDRDDQLLLERQLLKRIARINGVILPKKDEA